MVIVQAVLNPSDEVFYVEGNKQARQMLPEIRGCWVSSLW